MAASQNLNVMVEELYKRWEQKITYHKEVIHYVLHDILLRKRGKGKDIVWNFSFKAFYEILI